MSSHGREGIRLAALFLLLISPLLVVGQATSQPTTKPSEIRIISCAPNLTEIIASVGLESELVGVTPYCEYPASVKDKPKIGGLFNPNLEAMLAARPTHLITTVSHDKVHEFFRNRTDVEVHIFPHPDTLEDIQQTILDVAAVFDRTEQAEKLVDETRREWAAMDQNYPANERTGFRVLIVIGRDKGRLSNLYVAGHGTYLDEMLDRIGSDNAAPESIVGYKVMNTEALLSSRPDLILEFHAEGETPEVRKEIEQAWGKIGDGHMDGRVRIVADKHVLVPGPFLERDLKTMEEALYAPRPVVPPHAKENGTIE